MIEVQVIDKEGKKVGVEELDPAILGSKVHHRLLKEAVLMYQANRRLGNAHTKTRGEVAGSTRKRWRQKGTGRARVGSGKVSHWRGGGVVHGPRPRDFSYRLPKKALRLATKSALLAQFLEGKVVLLDELELERPRTKEVYGILRSASLLKKCLLVIDGYDKNILLSTRNIPRVKLSVFKDLNAYWILKYENILMTKKAFDLMKASYSAKEGSAG